MAQGTESLGCHFALSRNRPLCEKLHDDAEHLFRTLSSRLDALQDGN
ncbi:Rop family plasmid primer RNA-binding protein [Klebsiella pneumoniae]|nr:Rop family plasmid primer RNA-binding protein [Klebsiella pneumoniae]